MFQMPEWRADRARIRLPALADASLWRRYGIDNREHLAPWEPRRDDAHDTLDD
ncbi:MAG TPA: hypothetical protein VF269_01295 [Rhodanobacteraceae bacterium]